MVGKMATEPSAPPAPREYGSPVHRQPVVVVTTVSRDPFFDEPHRTSIVVVEARPQIMTPPGAVPGDDVPEYPGWVYGYPNGPCVQKFPGKIFYNNSDDPRGCTMVFRNTEGGLDCGIPAGNLATTEGRLFFLAIVLIPSAALLCLLVIS